MRAADFAYLDAPTPIGLAHRGGAKVAANLHLENTLAAFRHAVDLGYRYLETDVHATSDGQLLAFHDHVLDRVTDARGTIAHLPYAAVRTARVNGTEPIPLLSELLEEFPQARVNIDVKADGAVERLADVVRRHDAFDRVCIGSFSRRRLRAVRALLGPAVATAAGPSEVAVLRFAPSVVADWLRSPAPVLQVPTGHVVGGRRLDLVTPALVERVHAMGKHLHVWTIDDATEMHRLFDLGVDGIVTDRTDTLAEVLAERGVPLGR
ncbi:glycerophosphodiester phosphodiesterase family protein [Phycicoccus sp. Root563]|uniref:glycerophosphodiester phosphodiesterase family protein n=1 Tax=Phycicoccus sp. Root563 TaxID=1736562 RepID=UPI000702FAB6|nr:glycerophosphodiester phosphodiesterase family protein [Phycicoccus sp. Root563]KQZ87647.1 glycerophosphodiester phosphodiesterase [Phycicoccus sp. Root563]